jgi:pullulanase/glycogen debranching enzyme
MITAVTRICSRALIGVLGWALTSAVAGAAPAQTRPPTRADCDRPEVSQVLQPAEPVAAAGLWLDRRTLRWPGVAAPGRFVLLKSAVAGVQAVVGRAPAGFDGRLALVERQAALPPAVVQRFTYAGEGVTLQLPRHLSDLPVAWLQQPVRLAQLDAAGRVVRSTALQAAGALDDRYADRAATVPLGVAVAAGQTTFRLWAPTARHVSVCLYPDSRRPAGTRLDLRREAATGVWQRAVPRDLSGGSYTYLVDVHAPGVGAVRNRVTDPYSLSLGADSARSWIGRLDAPGTLPPGWALGPHPATVKAATDLVIYELHLRDFSASDATVPAPHRGKYLAFTDTASDGMQHLAALARAGVTDLHLLPVFDFASVPEAGCVTPRPEGSPDSESQQATIASTAATDCYNWGYDPWHFGAPEGSYATDASDGAVRIREFRQMVQSLHRAGLRVGMDVVYNHTMASGQHPQSVLDRIVPGYYHRLDAQGHVLTSTCCANTATENRMMARLMIDTAVTWARDYGIDSFRFDLMGHQPREAMERLQQAVDRATGRHIHLLGEGWNFGEVADGRRFVQAAQGALAGSSIATFSDRGRDAVRGGGCCDDAAATLRRQGWIDGLHLAPNPAALAAGETGRDALLKSADLVRVALAGTLRGYRMTTRDGSTKTLAELDYDGRPAGYASQPDEVVNYVENHDNPTLFDIAVLKLPPDTSAAERARVQVLGLAVTAFSQGLAYFHAGVEGLRSKSLDRNSFNSGDWFNQLDWTFSDNHYGAGLPPKAESGGLWPAMKPLLADPAIKPQPADIRFARDAFFDLLKIRASSALFRLRTADDVASRLRFLNTGPQQLPGLIVGHLDGHGLAGAGFAEVLYAINADLVPASLALPELQGRPYRLHPVHQSAEAADPRPAQAARWDALTGVLTVPPRTALVYVADR